jgi:hypothetical protein
MKMFCNRKEDFSSAAMVSPDKTGKINLGPTITLKFFSQHIPYNVFLPFI